MSSHPVQSVSQIDGTTGTFSPDIYQQVQDTISQLSVALTGGNDDMPLPDLHPVIVVLPTINNVFILLQLDDPSMKEFMLWAKNKQVGISDNFVAIPVMLHKTSQENDTPSSACVLKDSIATASQAIVDIISSSTTSLIQPTASASAGFQQAQSTSDPSSNTSAEQLAQILK